MIDNELSIDELRAAVKHAHTVPARLVNAAVGSAVDLRRRHARTSAPIPRYSVDPEELDGPDVAQPDDPFDGGWSARGVVAASAGLIPAKAPPGGMASGPLASIKIWQVHCG
jgi:hypothetical protein